MTKVYFYRVGHISKYTTKCVKLQSHNLCIEYSISCSGNQSLPQAKGNKYCNNENLNSITDQEFQGKNVYLRLLALGRVTLCDLEHILRIC